MRICLAVHVTPVSQTSGSLQTTSHPPDNQPHHDHADHADDHADRVDDMHLMVEHLSQRITSRGYGGNTVESDGGDAKEITLMLMLVMLVKLMTNTMSLF